MIDITAKVRDTFSIEFKIGFLARRKLKKIMNDIMRFHLSLFMQKNS